MFEEVGVVIASPMAVLGLALLVFVLLDRPTV
jgi:hypothetical protein